MNNASLLVAILASSTICSNNCVLGFVSPSVYPVRTATGTATATATASNCITYSSVVPLNYAPESDEDFITAPLLTLTQRFTSPVLKQHCGELVAWKETYGHPNIPLKNDGGNACQILRRLHVQLKLNDDEVEWLDSIGFRWHSIEDVYRFADFDDMMGRLLVYEKARPNNNFQVPKKCPEDPELGAWVTGIRRLGKDGVNPDHERRLVDVNFAWKSTRKCGSKFMSQFREWTKQVELRGVEAVLEDDPTNNVVAWIQAQQQALKKGKLSQTRVQYMGLLFGERWTTIGKEDVVDNIIVS